MYKHKLTKNLNNLEDANLPDDAVMFKESNNVETFVPKMLIVCNNCNYYFCLRKQGYF